ncbi:MAG TPA: glycosyltransferase family 39 protein [Gammaproteobacteria bacterium]|nr:glycosyltransferase family 39 protein [Gammaproteobacteria bacterium]
MQNSAWRTAFLCLFVAIVWFGNLQYRDLFQTDEGRYAEIPREMVATGDWITPHLDGFKYFEKPALHYWITATIYELAGQHNWTARLWIALAGFLGLGMTWIAGAKLFDERTGRYGALMLAGSFYYIFMGHFNTLDMGLAFFMCASLFAFLIAQNRPDDKAHLLRWMLAAWAAAALALLTKGLVALAIPGVTFVLYSITRRDSAIWKRLCILPGLALFLAISAPWFVVVSLRNPDFFHFFFVVQHFERYLTPIADRTGPWYYFIPVLILGTLPWLWQGGAALVRSAGSVVRRDNTRFDPVWFLWLWVVVIFVFFSASDSKLASYILPLMPAFALLTGRELARHERKSLTSAAAITLALGAACLIYAIRYLPHLHSHTVPATLYARMAPWAIAAAIVLIVAAAAGFGLIRRRPAAAVTLIALGWLVSVQVLTSGGQALSPVYSTRYLVAQMDGIDTRGAPFYSVKEYEQSLPFYLKRTVIPVDYQGELAFGIQRRKNPGRYIVDMATFEQRWRADPRAFAIMSRDDYHALRQTGIPMRVIARDPQRVIVTKGPVHD